MNHALFRALEPYLFIPVLVVTLGCAHTMEVTNLEDYQLPKTESSRIDIAVKPFSSADSDKALYYDHVIQGLKRHPSVNSVVTTQGGGAYPSSTVTIEPSADYEGSGVNFLIDFPGFLVFANAWNGFVYYANIDTTITMDKGSGTESLKIPVTYSMRHCDFGRGFWSGTGWWFPGWGLTNIIVGAVHTGYDTDATAPLHRVIATPYGDYVAEKIVRSILGLPQPGAEEPSSVSNVAPRR